LSRDGWIARMMTQHLCMFIHHRAARHVPMPGRRGERMLLRSICSICVLIPPCRAVVIQAPIFAADEREGW
jgi:hypothetical protein